MRSKDISKNKITIVIFWARRECWVRTFHIILKKKNEILKFEKIYSFIIFEIIKKLNTNKPSIIFNCIGKIPQKCTDKKKNEFLKLSNTKIVKKKPGF